MIAIVRLQGQVGQRLRRATWMAVEPSACLAKARSPLADGAHGSLQLS